VNIWTWIYAAVNAFLIFLGYRNDDVIGVVLFTIAILLLVYMRRNKPKPYNWLVKIILILQALVLLAFVVVRIEYFNIIALLMIVVFFVNIRLIFKGNKP
jgi:L-cystine uptake protein TcyP (sodium:dicarboxylate symporter family)